MRKNGFTLIELLAVIIILGVIALITVPVVLKMINNSRKNSATLSAKKYIEGIKSTLLVNSGVGLKNAICTINEENVNTIICNGEVLEVNIEGNSPKCGGIVVEDNKLKTYTFNIAGYRISKYSENESETVEKTQDCDYEYINKNQASFVNYMGPGLYDENYKLLASWDDLVSKYKLDIEKDHIYPEYSSGTLISVMSKNNELRSGKILIISSDVKKIGGFNFYYNGITNIKIPDSVTSIGTYAFIGCTDLTSIEIPDSVTSIGSAAFNNCTSLKEITIPASVTSIGSDAFSDCTALTSIKFNNTTGWYVSNKNNATSGTNVSVTSPSRNANYLKNTYKNYYWKKN